MAVARLVAWTLPAVPIFKMMELPPLEVLDRQLAEPPALVEL
jgi:hypothetical protein